MPSSRATSGVIGATAKPSLSPEESSDSSPPIPGSPSPFGISEIFTRSVFSLPSRSTLRSTSLPIGVAATIDGSSCDDFTGLPSYSMTTSPRCRPALAPGASSLTPDTSAPCGSDSPNDLARSSVTSWIITPSQPRTTLPCVFS